MAATEQVELSILSLEQSALDNEIRIVQSVQNQRNMPELLMGNLSAVMIVLVLDFAASVSSFIAPLLVVEVLLLVPMLRSYLKLRGRPRPETVSRRRIRTIEFYTLVLGLVWAFTVFLIMGTFSQLNAVIALLMVFILSYGASALSPGMPRAALMFQVPVMLAGIVGAYLNAVLPQGLLVLLGPVVMIVMVRTSLQSWHDLNQRVKLGLENVAAEAQRSRMMTQISEQLGRYMSPQLYQSIFSGSQKVEIASRRKKLTVFFSDIVGFTEITDQLEPEEVTELLNRYLSEMSRIVLAHGGTIDKFIGDGIVVYFGDPETRGVREDAAACVRMAIAMRDEVKTLKREWIDLGLERTFELRIGINTGYCTVGNFGSLERMDYTIIGSPVNLAARLESAADVGGILLANETHSLVKDWVDAQAATSITVKGFTQPVKTFRVAEATIAPDGKAVAFRHVGDGISVEIDPARVQGPERKVAIVALKKALRVLADES